MRLILRNFTISRDEEAVVLFCRSNPVFRGALGDWS